MLEMDRVEKDFFGGHSKLCMTTTTTTTTTTKPLFRHDGVKKLQ